MEIHAVVFFFASVFYAEVEGEVGTHYFVSKKMSWTDAQTHCRKYYTDLSPLNDKEDNEKMLTAAEGVTIGSAYLGLHRDPENPILWKWSGGGYITYTNWAKYEPSDSGAKETKGMMFSNGQWNDIPGNISMYFFCIKVSAMKDEKKSWEDALEHCREKQSDLISIGSETDRLLAQTEMQRNELTEHVWIGLRFLSDRWLWVDGMSMVYKAWPEGGDQDHRCPTQRRCGALTVRGLWGNFNCEEKRYFLCK